MAVVVVGGHSRNVGKTSVAAGLIAALVGRRWTAVKITQYGHNVCSSHEGDCECKVANDGWAIVEEHDRSGKTDTSRFLAAGAVRSLWVRTRQGRLAEAMPDVRAALKEEFRSGANLMIESNSAMRFLRADLYLSVLNSATEDFKDSAREYLDLASALVMHRAAKDAEPQWKHVSLKPVQERPVFYINPPQYVTQELVTFVRQHLVRSMAPAR